MNAITQATTLSVGWDVGGWNCEKNGTSRDAIVIIDDALSIVGKPWRGNLRATIATAPTLGDWLDALFAKCGLAYADRDMSITMAIDTPLGFPDAFVGSINGRGHVEADEVSGLNRYLFRQTERHLFEQGLKPLSAVKDIFGSQATKGMHVLAKFAPHRERCAVWGDGAGFRAIETYPTACPRSALITERVPRKSLGHDDLDDAFECALTAHAFAHHEGMFDAPPDDLPAGEGWIWVPRP